MKPGHISSVYLLSLLRIMEEMGYSREQALAAGSLDANDLLNPKKRVPMADLLAILRDAGEILDRPNIGLQVGYQFRVHTFTETGSILALCGTLAEAAQINAMYQPLAETIGAQTFERREDGAFLIWAPHFTDDDAYRQVTEMIMAGYATTTNWLSWGFDRGVDTIYFRHSAPESSVGYEMVFGPRVRFNAEFNGLRFNSKTVDRPLPTSNPEKLAHVRRRLDFIVQRAAEKSGLRERVAAEIMDALANQAVSFDVVARRMGMSERTLRRNLAEENLSYRSILEDIRKSLCEAYMNDGRSLTEIAQLLGYNDQSAFTRAFKNWHGEIPSQYKPRPISL